MTDEGDWDGIDPPIVIMRSGFIWQAFCTKKAPGEEVSRLANEYHHPGTSNGWVWPSDTSFAEFQDANNEKYKGLELTMDELKNGIQCKNFETHRHYFLHC